MDFCFKQELAIYLIPAISFCPWPWELKISGLEFQIIEAYSLCFIFPYQIATAVKFLQNSRVRQSPLATRRAFLKKKGTGFLGSVERPVEQAWAGARARAGAGAGAGGNHTRDRC